MTASETIILHKSGPGTYLLKLNGVVVYVGASRNVLSRCGHEEIEYDSVHIYWCESFKVANELEKKLIKELRPTLNVVYNPVIFERHEAARKERARIREIKKARMVERLLSLNERRKIRRLLMMNKMVSMRQKLKIRTGRKPHGLRQSRYYRSLNANNLK